MTSTINQISYGDSGNHCTHSYRNSDLLVPVAMLQLFLLVWGGAFVLHILFYFDISK